MITDCRSISREDFDLERIFEVEIKGNWLNISEGNLLPVEVDHCIKLYKKRKAKNIMFLQYQCDVLNLVNEA